MERHLILPALYLPPIAYFRIIHAAALPVLLEQHEHYPKQTYRNRASIYGANGILDLIIPIKKGQLFHTKMQDVQISYESDWQRLHWMSIQTAYRSSAYFEYYEDDFAQFYEKPYESLLAYNKAQLTLLLKLLRIEAEIRYTESYRKDYAADVDFRQTIHPKKPSPAGPAKPYYQVFASKHGFLPDLSIVDLLFNHGPQSKDYL